MDWINNVDGLDRNRAASMILPMGGQRFIRVSCDRTTDRRIFDCRQTPSTETQEEYPYGDRQNQSVVLHPKPGVLIRIGPARRCRPRHGMRHRERFMGHRLRFDDGKENREEQEAGWSRKETHHAPTTTGVRFHNTSNEGHSRERTAFGMQSHVSFRISPSPRDFALNS